MLEISKIYPRPQRKNERNDAKKQKLSNKIENRKRS